jgi:hypothetical protein
MLFSCEIKDFNYSISESPEPGPKTVHPYPFLFIDATHLTCISIVLLSTWPKILVHINLTSPHPGAEVSTEISPQIVHFCRELFKLLANLIKESKHSWSFWNSRENRTISYFEGLFMTCKVRHIWSVGNRCYMISQHFFANWRLPVEGCENPETGSETECERTASIIEIICLFL